MLLPDHAFQLTYGPNDNRLHDFYLPALERSVLYRRAAGFFSSSALAVAAAGVVRLIHNGGSMRLLCGAELSEDDVEAIRRGESLEGRVEDAMLRNLEERLADADKKRRLEVLAWLVAEGRLEIRVVLRKGADGRPLPGSESLDYYHPKEGVFEDAEGNKLAFSGSSNESATGWKNNYETFHVFTSWDRRFAEQVVPEALYYIAPVEHRFTELWSVRETDDWIALDIPQAARERLLTYRPDTPPDRDPLEREAELGLPPEVTAAGSDRDRLIFQFLREACFLPEASRLGVETSAVTPWPHQDRVVDAVVEKYPHSFLFCDEVGLGKTIEAGLAFRQLVISGRVRRSLFLVPASVLRQWQEELWEKCALNIPRYERGHLVDVFNEEVIPLDGPPWNRVPHLLASSQLAKRKERQEEVLGAAPWDLVLVDEAHHARRKEFAVDRYRPNRLLELLGGTGRRPGLKDRTRCLYLLTATPMQVHPLEVWDLLKLVGMGGRWGALQENFLRFFVELRERSFSERDWDFLLDMVEDYVATGGSLDEGFVAVGRERVGPVEWDLIQNLPDAAKRRPVIRQLSKQGRGILEGLVDHHTPIRTFVWRNTRELLRRYREKGILKERVPSRDPKNEWIPMEPDEWDLYERIEEYISDFYQKYEAERKGLGFVMTVYRRRLTSSFYAIRRSLERRLEFLKGAADPMAGLTDEDIEQEELDLDVTEGLSERDRERFLAELEYVEDFLRGLRVLSTDSKLEFLKKQIGQLFSQRDTVILFTQYTDTMDYLRDQLRAVHGSDVACYSGRGGEVWDGVAWVPRGKEEIKEEFRKGETIKLLVCTESASEGLNLQTCGVLINYDMPWNPMRVEQRIGRIDRIGQKYDEVWIRNYFYEETVEAKVYQRLSDRIDWFEHVVGQLQPILHRVGRTIQEVALLGRAERDRRLDQELAEIRRQLDEQTTAALNLDVFVDTALAGAKEPSGPVNLHDLERELTESTTLQQKFEEHPEIAGAYRLAWGDDSLAVTFRPDVFDRHPYTVQLLTYGNPLLEELLRAAGEPPASEEERGVLLLRDHRDVPVSLFARKDGSEVSEVPSLTNYEQALDDCTERWVTEDRKQAYQAFEEAQQQVGGQLESVESERREAARRALLEEARQILTRSALLRRALSERMDLFEDFNAPAFASNAVLKLAELGVPYRGLISILGGDTPDVSSTDPFYLEIQGKSEAVLRGKLEALKQRGLELLRRYRDVTKEGAVEAESTTRVEERWLMISRRVKSGQAESPRR